MRLAAEWDFSIIGEAPDGETALDLAISLCPDVVIIDVDMLSTDGMAIASMLHSACPEVSIVILSIRDDTFTCERAGEVGAAAFVAKSMPADALLMAIRRVAHFM
jgi:DNA-binding NarL/FixJ family response regulator